MVAQKFYRNTDSVFLEDFLHYTIEFAWVKWLHSFTIENDPRVGGVPQAHFYKMFNLNGLHIFTSQNVAILVHF